MMWLKIRLLYLRSVAEKQVPYVNSEDSDKNAYLYTVARGFFEMAMHVFKHKHAI